MQRFCAGSGDEMENRSCAEFPLKTDGGDYAEGVVLDLDLWLVLPQ